MKPAGDNARSHATKSAMGTAVLSLLLAFVLPRTSPAGHKTVPTFTKDVAPILLKNCLKCHRTGELAFKVPLTSYESVRTRAELIKEKVLTREMPPWPADPDRSLKFRNDPRLNQLDIKTIVAWINAGAPRGGDADPLVVSKTEDSWMHPQGLKPDMVISLPGEVHLPANGALPYARILVKVPSLEDMWIQAIQARPSNPAVVHHMALTEVELPNGLTPSIAEQVARQIGAPNRTFDSPAVTTSSNRGQPDMLAMYTPGSGLEMYPDGSAKLLKGGKNMYIVFNIHYETTGKPETDQSRIGLWFAPGPPKHQLFRVNGAGETIIANGRELLTDDPGTKAEGTHVVIPPIPPFADNYELIGVTAYPEPITIYQFQPHAHHRGKDFTYTVVYPDGHEQTVLSVPKFDHRWQMAYELETPLKLPAGSKLVVTAHYDNSKMNMHNPGPDKAVYFRDMNRSSDEMFTPFTQYSIDDREPGKAPVATFGPGREENSNMSQRPQGAEKGGLEIGQVVGCLEAGHAGGWLLTNGSEPTANETQATSSMELKAATGRPLGSQRYQLIGVGVFKPSLRQGEKVAVKGILINGSQGIRVNVTSLQTVATNCAR
jgi:hypothetical protein